jgi:ABC-type nitrate/sulfonate/bicarbonate transport system ATPase subunit
MMTVERQETRMRVDCPPVLSFQNVGLRLGAEQVLAGLNLQVSQGEVVAILGRSGSGKTTLLRLAAGLLGPDEGQVLYPAQPETGHTPVIGYVFQDARLLPWLTVAANLRLTSPAHRWPEIPGALARVGLVGTEKLYPGQLSLGMAQRASVARALLLHPALLLLDEPHSALDELTAAELRANLAQLLGSPEGRQTTSLLVTHNPAEAVELADRMVLLSGRPARLQAETLVQLPRPRDPDSPDFWAEVSRVRALLRDAEQTTPTGARP